MPSQSFLAQVRHGPLTRRKAWACAALNQLAFPGLGTIMAGRWTGYVQAVIMVAGFVLFTGFILLFFKAMFSFAMDPAALEQDLKAAYQPYAWAAESGLGLCLLAWFWALFSSFALLRQTRPKPPPPIP